MKAFALSLRVLQGLLPPQAANPALCRGAAVAFRGVHVSAVAHKDEKGGKKDILLVQTKNGVTTMTMNNPKRLNGWTQDMLMALKDAFEKCAKDPNAKVAVLTGTDPYYCAGVNLSDSIKPMHPKKLHGLINEHNYDVFNAFIEFPKPMVVAVNGPAIGACVTSATLMDRVVASERATFSTPFARLGIPPEGCSSLHFYRIMSKANAERMLGKEGWVPTAKEAVEAGLIQECVPHDRLMERAQEVAEQWIKDGKKRWMREENKVAEYQAVNRRESEELATAFLSHKFIDAQYNFLKSKGKTGPARFFWLLKTLRPIWSKML